MAIDKFAESLRVKIAIFLGLKKIDEQAAAYYSLRDIVVEVQWPSSADGLKQQWVEQVRALDELLHLRAASTRGADQELSDLVDQVKLRFYRSFAKETIQSLKRVRTRRQYGSDAAERIWYIVQTFRKLEAASSSKELEALLTQERDTQLQPAQMPANRVPIPPRRSPAPVPPPPKGKG